MSASEKLRALDDGLNVRDGIAAGLHLQAAVLTVQRALPQIVAVVEAAKKHRAAERDIFGAHRIAQTAEDLDAALAALDEALS